MPSNNNNNSNESNALIDNNNKINNSPKQTSFSNSFSIQSNTSSAELCRICYASAKKERLVHPCKCSGTMGLIHKSCLEKWLSSSNTNECEICHHKFTVKRKARPFYQWFVRPVSTRDHKNLFGDLICFLVLTPLAVISAWLCILGALRYQQWENKWEAVGLVLLTLFLMFIYITWCIVSLKYHIKIYKEWQLQNHIVSLNISTNSRNSSASRRSTRTATPNRNNNNIIINPDITTTPTTTITSINGNNIIKLSNLNNQFTTILIEEGDDRRIATTTTTTTFQTNDDDNQQNNNNDEQTDELFNTTHISSDSTIPFAYS